MAEIAVVVSNDDDDDDDRQTALDRRYLSVFSKTDEERVPEKRF